MKITGNEPSMPCLLSTERVEKDIDNNDVSYYFDKKYPGLTIRQQFAMAAMQGLIPSAGEYFKDISPEKIATYSVQFADALINELNK